MEIQFEDLDYLSIKGHDHEANTYVGSYTIENYADEYQKTATKKFEQKKLELNMKRLTTRSLEKNELQESIDFNNQKSYNNDETQRHNKGNSHS